MSGRLAEAPVIVGKMLAEGADGITAVAWVKFAEEQDDEASAYQVLRGGRLEPLDGVGPWGQWKVVAALVADMGG